MNKVLQARTFLGVRFDLSNFIKIEKTFDHDYPENYQFDPISGKPLWKKTRGSDATAFFNEIDFGSGAPIVWVEDEYTNYMIIGYVLCQVNWINKNVDACALGIDYLPEMAEQLVSRLKEAGLPVDFSTVNLYTVANHSI